MTCKDCIHNGICHLQYMRGEKYKDVELSECSDFKDKSKYIELPCKVGDTVYCIAGNIIFKSKIHCISFGGRFGFDGGQIHIYDYDKDNASMPLSYFGKRIFFTKEEAEQKLKELKENA